MKGERTEEDFNIAGTHARGRRVVLYLTIYCVIETFPVFNTTTTLKKTLYGLATEPGKTLNYSSVSFFIKLDYILTLYMLFYFIYLNQ